MIRNAQMASIVVVQFHAAVVVTFEYLLFDHIQECGSTRMCIDAAVHVVEQMAQSTRILIAALFFFF